MKKNASEKDAAMSTENDGTPSESRSRGRFLIRPSIVIAATLAVVAALWIATGDFQGYGKDPQAQAAPTSAEDEAPAEDGTTTEKKAVAVRVFDSVAQPRTAHLLLTGRTEADRRAELQAETEGRIVKVAAEAADRVTEGQVLVELATDDRMAQLREARALVKQREIEFNAADKLSKKGFQSETARAQARAQLEAAQAQLERIQVDVNKTKIEAPFDGIIQERMVEIGDFAQVGTPLVHIVDLDPMAVTVQVSEREIDRIELGTTAAIRLVSGGTVTGIVSRISPTAADETRTFEVEIEISNTDGRLRDGVTAQVRLPTKEAIAHQLSPAVLTLNDEGAIGVKAVNADDEVVFHPVSILEDQADGIWVTGLPTTLTVISVGQEYVAEGSKVRPIPDGRFGKAGEPKIELDPVERDAPPRVSSETSEGVSAQ